VYLGKDTKLELAIKFLDEAFNKDSARLNFYPESED